MLAPMRMLGPIALALFTLACEAVIPEGRYACTSDEDCPDEMVCRTHVSRCYHDHADAGTAIDAAARDGGP